MLTEPILVGRERELEELNSFLNSAVEGRGKTVFISGEAGAGKTKLVTEFFSLLLITRRRHRLLPQPRAWFQNLADGMGDRVEVRIARKNGTPIAAMFTLRHKSTVLYKYGCSDEKFHNLGGMPFLFWRLIEDSKLSKAEKIDLGRSDMDNRGLVVFKDRLGATRRKLTYYRYLKGEGRKPVARWDSQMLRRFFSFLPGTAFSAAGRLLYRHMG